MKCPNCRRDEAPITSSMTGITYCPGCGVPVGRAFTPGRPRENILQIIRLVKARDNGLLTREQCDDQVNAITTRQPELPLETAAKAS